MLTRHLPAELQDLARVAREVAQNKIAPLVRETEAAGTFSPAIRDILGEAGFLGIVVPEEFGGVDADLRAEMVIVEEVAKVYPSAATYLTAHWVSTKLLVAAARAGQRDQWLVDTLAAAAAGEKLGALAATEPEAGSDLARVRTTATRQGDQWVLNGSKRFITNGGFADYYVVLARTGGAGGRGISLIFAEAGRAGLTATRLERKMGLHGSATAELAFEDLRVPGDHLVGVQDQGFGMIMNGLNEGRIIVAGLALGTASAALDHSVAYAASREQFGTVISDFQGVQFLIADMAIGVHTARSMVYDAADAYVNGDPDATRLASIAKTYASDMCMQVTTDAVQVHGGYGYVDDFPVEMLMRDAKIHQIYEGTNQIQRSIIARSYFGRSGR